MQALQFHQTGSLDYLQLLDLPVPLVRPGFAVVEVGAAGINPSDVKNVLGRFPYTTVPRVPGRDFAGTVVAGPGEWVGRAVWGSGRDLGFFRDGSHAEYLTLPLNGLTDKPQALSFEQAASCGVPFLTALDALDRAGVGANTRLLVIGAAGSVGQAALQLARLRGARAVAAVRRAQQCQLLAAAGHATLLLDDPAQLASAVKAHFADGADVVFDTTGFWLGPAVAALATLGRIAVIAAPAGGQVDLPLLELYRRGGSIVGINSLLHDSVACAAMLARLAPHFDNGALSAADDLQVWPLERGPEAYALLNQGSVAKIVLRPTRAGGLPLSAQDA